MSRACSPSVISCLTILGGWWWLSQHSAQSIHDFILRWIFIVRLREGGAVTGAEGPE